MNRCSMDMFFIPHMVCVSAEALIAKPAKLKINTKKNTHTNTCQLSQQEETSTMYFKYAHTHTIFTMKKLLHNSSSCVCILYQIRFSPVKINFASIFCCWCKCVG